MQRITSQNLSLSSLLSVTLSPLFNKMLETQISKTNTKNKEIRQKNRQKIIKIQNDVLPSNIFKFIKQPTRPILKYNLHKNQFLQNLKEPQCRYNRAYSYEKQQKQQQRLLQNIQRYKEISKKLMQKTFQKKQQNKQLTKRAQIDNYHILMQFSKQTFCKILRKSTYSPVERQQTSLAGSPKLFKSCFKYSDIQKLLSNHYLNLCATLQQKQRYCHQYIGQLKLISQYRHYQQKNTILLNQPKKASQNLLSLKEIEEKQKENIRYQSFFKIHQQVIFYCQNFEQNLPNIPQYEISPAKKQTFSTKLRQKIKKIAISGKLLYQVEGNLKKYCQQLDNKIKMQFISKKSDNNKPKIPLIKKDSLKIRNTRLQKKQFDKNKDYFQKDHKQMEKMRNLEQSRVAKVFTSNQKQGNYIKIVPKSKISSFAKQINYSMNNQQKYGYKKQKKTSLYEEKKQELLNYMGQRTNSIDFSMYAYRKSKSKKVLDSPQVGQYKSPQVLVRKKSNPYEQVSYIFQNVLIQNSNECWIQYHIQSIRLKELTIKFLSDRRRFCVNQIKLLIPPLFQMPLQYRQKVMKCLQILNCLGAVTWLQQIKPYRHIERKDNIYVSIGAFMMGRNPSSILSII